MHCYETGVVVLLACGVAQVVLAAMLRYLLILRNKRRDKAAAETQQAPEDAGADVTDFHVSLPSRLCFRSLLIVPEPSLRICPVSWAASGLIAIRDSLIDELLRRSQRLGMRESHTHSRVMNLVHSHACL